MKPDTAFLRLEPKLRTRQELAGLLKISYSTLWRRMKAMNGQYGRALINLRDQQEIAKWFGYRIEWLG
jgi:ABC-type branched-subunit amino acid transport system permease subunit